MTLPFILFLAVVVVVVAYVLGRVWRARDKGPTIIKPPPTRASPKTTNNKAEAAPKAADVVYVAQDRDHPAVVNWLLSQAFEQTGIKVADDKVAYQRIVEAATQALTELKTQNSAIIKLPFLTADANGPKHFEVTLTREVLEELARY